MSAHEVGISVLAPVEKNGVMMAALCISSPPPEATVSSTCFMRYARTAFVVCSITRSGVVWRSQFSICADSEKTGDGKEMP